MCMHVHMHMRTHTTRRHTINTVRLRIKIRWKAVKEDIWVSTSGYYTDMHGQVHP